MKKFYLTLSILCLSYTVSLGQGFSILNNSNYTPVSSVYFNPAKIADSRQKLQINLYSLNAYAANDYAEFISVPKFVKAIQNDGNVEDFITEFTPNGKNKNINSGVEGRLPFSFVASLGKNQSMAFTTRTRIITNGNNISEKLMPILFKGLEDTDQFGNIPNATFDVNANIFTEAGLSYGKVLFNTGKNMLKAGVTGKYLFWGRNAQVNNNKTNMSVIDKTLYKTIATNGVDVNSYISDPELLSLNSNKLSLRSLTDGKGQGFAADFGIEYEFRPKFKNYQYEVDGKMQSDNSVPQYAIKFGFAVTDLGSITYASGKQLSLIDNTNKEWTLADVNQFDLEDLEGSLINVYGATAVKSTLKYRSDLPSRMNMNLDFKVVKNFYIAANYMGPIAQKKGVIDPLGTLFSINPRIEKSSYEIALPITYSSRYKKTNLGIATRSGAFFIGTDDVAGVLGLGKFTSANFYTGLNIAIGKKRIKDSDGDHISDKLDKCPKIAGPKENDGCPWPDADKDGIPDKDDSCPNLPGPAKTNGCPDSDGDGVADQGDNCPAIPGTLLAQGCPDADSDGIADKDDLCPTQPGSRDAKGCPDIDRDGIADRDDLCPEIAGTLAMKGCPDRDSDGITDKEDACPDLPGPLMSKGCPDTDKDGILDSEDLCPTIAGPLAFKGCPDSDKDGTADSEDACPEIAGPPSSKGCPDKDGDGVADKDDKCIDVVGPASNSGCPITEKPVLTKVEEKIIFTAVSDLQFETGKSVIKAYSFDSLDELAALMVKRPELTLILSGHTDNVGVPAKNKILSVKRAQAVKSYLMDAGVDGSRIAATGYGSTKPVASNKTPKGRQKNRRVEFKVN